MDIAPEVTDKSKKMADNPMKATDIHHHPISNEKSRPPRTAFQRGTTDSFSNHWMVSRKLTTLPTTMMAG